MIDRVTVQDLLWLLHFERLAEHVFWYHPDMKATYKSSVDLIPWPLIWLLGRYNRKHISCPKILPRIDRVIPYITQVRHRLAWKWLLRSQQSSPLLPPIKGVGIPPCPVPVDAALEAWSSRAGKMIIDACRHAVSKHTIDRCFATMNSITTFALRFLQRCKVAVIPCDKDGGYTLTDKASLNTITEGILQNGNYKEIAYSTTDNEKNWAIASYVKLATKISNHFKEPALRSAILKSLRISGGSIVSRLKLTCKTHKPEGSVGFRALHTTPAYSFMGMGLWLCMIIRKAMDNESFDHIIVDSRQFMLSIQRLKPRSSSFFRQNGH